MFIFFLLACSNPETVQEVPPQKTTLAPDSNAQTTSQGAPPSLGIESKEETTINQTTSPFPDEAPSQVKEESSHTTTSASSNNEAIPSPNIEGMSKKEKEDKIYAEDIDKVINKPEEKTQEQPSNEVVEVTVESNYNAHFDDSNSNILVQVYKDSSTIAASMSHDHVIRARGWEGQVIWKPNEPHNCIFEFQIPVHFLEVDPDALRKKVNLPGVISKKDRKEIYKNMLSKNQLWAEKFSHINFSAQNCSETDKGVQVRGKITIRGVTKKISTLLQIEAEDRLSISGNFYLNQTSFGITPYSAFMGAVKNKNRIKISLDFKQ